MLNHFKDKNSEYFLNNIEKLIYHSKKCIEILSDYIDK